MLPPGIEDSPGRGEHRELDSRQALWLAMVLALKLNGVRVPVARQIVGFAEEAVQGCTRYLGWDFLFDPFAGNVATESAWIIEVGDLRWVRLLTDSYPSSSGLHALPWRPIEGGPNLSGDPQPLVTLRVDLRRLAQRVTS